MNYRQVVTPEDLSERFLATASGGLAIVEASNRSVVWVRIKAYSASRRLTGGFCLPSSWRPSRLRKKG
jgi:hypothetical protein